MRAFLPALLSASLLFGACGAEKTTPTQRAGNVVRFDASEISDPQLKQACQGSYPISVESNDEAVYAACFPVGWESGIRPGKRVRFADENPSASAVYGVCDPALVLSLDINDIDNESAVICAAVTR